MAMKLYKYKSGHITVREAARWCGVTESTIYKWLKQCGDNMEAALEKANSRQHRCLRRS